MGITHSTVAAGTDSGNGEIHKAEWNADHTGDYVSGVSGTGNIVVPGMSGFADRLPTSPNGSDDEFDTTSTLSSTAGSLDSNETTTFASHLYLRKNSTGTFQLHYVYKSAPSTPFTVTCKIDDYLMSANFQQYGIIIADSTPTAAYVHGPTYQSSTGVPELVYGKWTNRTTRGTIAEAQPYTGHPGQIKYIRMVVTSSTSVDVGYSLSGKIWHYLATAQNPGFTVSKVGLFLTGNDNSTAAEAAFDWIRFT